MKCLSLIVLIFLLQACTKEGSSISYIWVRNNTNHTVEIRAFGGGAVHSNKSFKLTGNGQYQIDYNSSRGKSSFPIVLSEYFRSVDSVQIIWDNTYIMTHMIADSFTSNGKYISFFDDKNIGKVSKYQQTKVSESKHSIEWSLFYNLTEQDYLEAKD